MKAQPTKTDNKSIANKIYIREQAIKDLGEVNVLDLFAGYNVLWNNINTKSYFGIDIENNKGRNLKTDTRKILTNFDMSGYNVIDCDSYGIAFDIYDNLIRRKDVKKGTVIFFTLITNEFTKIQNFAKEYFKFKHFYNKAPSLFNARAIEFLYEFLAERGIEEIVYFSIRDNFDKHYGYFIK